VSICLPTRFVHLSVYLSACLLIHSVFFHLPYPPVCPIIHLSNCLSNNPPCPFVYLFYPPVCPIINLSNYLSNNPPCPFVYLSICPSVWHVSISQSTHFLISASVYCVHLSICLSVRLSAHTSVRPEAHFLISTSVHYVHLPVLPSICAHVHIQSVSPSVHWSFHLPISAYQSIQNICMSLFCLSNSYFPLSNIDLFFINKVTGYLYILTNRCFLVNCHSENGLLTDCHGMVCPEVFRI